MLNNFLVDNLINTPSYNPNFLNEKINLYNFVQPHGVLFVLAQSTLEILQVSENTHYFFERNPEELLGKNLSIIFDQAQLSFFSRLLATEESLDNINPFKFSTMIKGIEVFFEGIINKITENDLIILELEPACHLGQNLFLTNNNLQLYNNIRVATKNINKHHNFKDLCDSLVREVQKITNFDRVMLYKFDPDGHGQVVAESIVEEKRQFLPSYLGLHFPSTDIPPMARELFLTNLIRFIPDLNNAPVRIIPPCNPLTNEPIPLNHSILRGVSPCHIEYLKNMGISASLCISLIKDKNLWGMIVCHHETPKYVPYQIRKACEFLGEVMASQPVEQEKAEDQKYKIKIQQIRSQLIELAVQSPNFAQELVKHSPNLLDICDATGAVFWHHNGYETIGVTPTESHLLELIKILKKQDNLKFFQTNCLADIYDQAETIKDIASGLLAIAIAPNQYILWFRPEVIQTVEWAGNPEEAFNFEQENLTPRKSFETWKQKVCLKSLPWKMCEIETVMELRKGLIAIVLHQIDELSRLNQALRESEAKEREKATQLAQTLLELQNTQTQLIQREKMSLLGEMVAGIAHEINNPISFIKGNISHAQEYIDDLLNLVQLYQEEYREPSDTITEEIEEIDLEFLAEDLPKMLTSMKLGIERITKIINSLRNFSRMDNSQKQAVDLHEGIESTLMILNHRLKASPDHPEIKVIKNYGDCPLVACYSSQINQVFMNILVNGIDALEEQYEKTKEGERMVIEISTKLLETEENSQVCIKIKDQGIGMTPEVKEKIFNNYFTTKPMGKGTGFGLAISQQIVIDNHGGELICESVLGEGTEFAIYLPL